MHCPFLSKLSSPYVRNHGSTLLKMYGQYCPFVSSISKLHVPADEVVSTSFGSTEKKCPFLAEVQKKDSVVTEVSTEIQEDVIKLKDERGKS